LAAAQFAQGKLHQAWHTSAQLAQAFEGRPQKLWAGLHLLQARLCYESNDLAQASDSLRTAFELLERVPGQPLVTRAYYAQLAQLQWAQGDVAAARVTLDDAERSTHRLADDVHFSRVSAQRACLDLKQGDLTAAVAWLHASPAHRDEPLDYRRQDEYLTRARVLIAQGSTSSLDEADQWLHRLMTQAETDGRNRDLIGILALKAILETRTDRPEQALVTLEHAVALAEPQGYIRTFVDEGEPIATLLKRIKPQSRKARTYVQTILAAFPQSEIVTPSLAEPLSEREIEVLRLIADGLSAKQIADNLTISVHTARTHIRNIYRKLDVRSRVQAAEIARDLNLI
jgi:LuxR family maltose regulon positive regulatory protein